MKSKYFFSALFLLLVQTTYFAQGLAVNGAEYRTKDSYLYGRFESSVKAPGKEGILTSLFTYFDGTPSDPWTSSKWNEIDIEILGRYNNDVQFNTITQGQTNHVRHQYVNFDPALDYHTYAFEWTPDYVAWFIDGAEVYRQTNDFVKTLIHAQKLMMNIWSPVYTNWAGVWNDAVVPAFGFYDWAAYYKYTPGTGNYGTNNNFTLSWKDDFNSFDSNIWEKGDHGFGGNRSDFVPNNIAFVDGKLILCLTDKNNTGFVDKSGPKVISVLALSNNNLRVFFSEQVEKTSTETSSNYILSGSSITKAVLMSDRRTVDLTVDQMDLSSLPTLIVRNIKDFLFPSNVMTFVAKSIVVIPQLKFPVKINVGGTSYKDFITDREFVSDTSSYGFMEGNKSGPFSNSIGNTVDDTLYQTEINGLAKYVVRVPNGKYKIKLLFADNYFDVAGARVFDIYVQGSLAVKALDVVKEVGAKNALEKVIDNVEVKDSKIDIHFAALVQRPFLNGVVIESLTTNSVEGETSIPGEFRLEQNYPNPFNPTTTIKFSIPAVETFRGTSHHVSLKVFDLLGREVASLVNEERPVGKYIETLHAESLPSGVYFYRLEAGNFTQTKKLILMK